MTASTKSARIRANGSECEDDDQCAAHCFEGQCAASFMACDLQ